LTLSLEHYLEHIENEHIDDLTVLFDEMEVLDPVVKDVFITDSSGEIILGKSGDLDITNSTSYEYHLKNPNDSLFLSPPFFS